MLTAALERAVRAKTRGVILTIMDKDGKEELITTGLYDRQKAEAIRAALQASMLLTKMESERKGS